MHDIPELTVPEVAARLGEPGFHVIDNNGAARWRRSHVPGAKHLNAYSFARGDLPEDTSATLVFYCAGPG
jgi:rhodanese-related sulfurtransferase